MAQEAEAYENNRCMIVQCATFSKSLNPRNIDKSVSDIRIRFTFESSFWISVSGCKLTILPDIQPTNRCGGLEMAPHVNKWSLLDGAHE